MTFNEIGRPPIEGELNTNEFVKTKYGLVLLKRIPKDNPSILDAIATEYGSIGFFDEGGYFRRRSFQDQLDLSENASFYDLRVLLPIEAIDQVIYYPYLESAVNYEEFLKSASAEEAEDIVLQEFDDLRSAHNKGIVYGDRWPPNILVIPTIGLVNIDFDIELLGVPAVEFEVAQVVFYTLASGKEKVIQILKSIINQSDGWFNYSLFAKFLKGHGNLFASDPKYGDLRKQITTLLN